MRLVQKMFFGTVLFLGSVHCLQYGSIGGHLPFLVSLCMSNLYPIFYAPVCALPTREPCYLHGYYSFFSAPGTPHWSVTSRTYSHHLVFTVSLCMGTEAGLGSIFEIVFHF